MIQMIVTRLQVKSILDYRRTQNLFLENVSERGVTKPSRKVSTITEKKV